MKSASVALHCSGAGAPEVVQHFYQILFRVGSCFLLFWARFGREFYYGLLVFFET